MNETTVTMSKAELEEFARKLIAKGQASANPANFGLPGMLYGNAEDRSVKREQARHIAQFCHAVIRRNDSAIAKLMQANADWYETKTAGDPLTEASNGAGLYLVPTIWVNQIFDTAQRYGYARRMASVMDLGSKTTNLTIGSGEVAVTWPGDDTAPTVTDGSSVFSQAQLVVATMAAAVNVQKELDEDAVASIINWVTGKFGKAVAKGEDSQFFNGTGSPFNGIAKAGVISTNLVTGTSGQTSFTSVTGWVNLVNLKNAVNMDIAVEGAYVVPQTVFGLLQTEVDDNHRPIWSNEQPVGVPNEALTVNQTPYRYNNSPMWVVPDAVWPTSGASKVAAVFGDFGNYAHLGIRRGLEIETFTESYAGRDLAGKREIALQVTERVAIAFSDETAFAALKTAAS